MITLCMTPLRDFTHSVVLAALSGACSACSHSSTCCCTSPCTLLLDQEGKLGALWQDIVKRPYITIGMLGLLLLIPLAVTSTAKAQRRLGRRWTRLHRLVYVVAVLGVWHYWWQVKKDVREPLLYVCGLALLLGYRLWKERRALAAGQRRTVSKDRWSLSSSVSVLCQSMHGSVIDTPYSSVLRSFGMG